MEPMILSFQNIQKQAGGTALALKTLAKSAFTGPGAIITVVSLASTALLMFGDRLFKAGDKAKKAAEDMKEFSSTLGGVIGTLQGDLLGGDADQLERLNDRYERTKQALADLQELEQIR
ncbi:hypothetical protein RZS08_32515, partial [Arthrospira platensis SPKY1]|nr:hypothetical protein [Arthrospira platensis SPKY1]